MITKTRRIIRFFSATEVDPPGANNRVLSEIAPNIIAQARSGNEDAFHAIYRRYGRPVTSFLYHHVNNRTLAEELAQETFVRAYRNLNFLKDDTRLSTWLFGIARNVAREAVRKNIKDEKNIPLDEPESLRVPSAGRNPDGAMLDRELNQTIKHALAGLDEDKRIVFSLKIFEERSYEEISAITGHSIGKLKTDLFRARAEMRKILEPYVNSSQLAVDSSQ